MVYSRDQWIQLPVRDLYDSQIMLASINAARDMYEKGQQQVKEFQKDYGDFYSPIQKDMDWYNKNIINGSRDVINGLYNKGIDPLRSAEGRAAINRWINNIPTGDINKLKAGAKMAQDYLKNRTVLESQNKYNDDYERWINGGKSIDNWDTLKDGMWTRQAPAQFTTLKEATNDWFNNRTPHSLTKSDVESFGMPYNKAYDYTGYTYGDLQNVANRNTPGWVGSPISDYYRHLAKQRLIDSGVNNPTKQQVELQLQKDVADANKEWMVSPVKTVNEYAKMDKQFAQQAAMQARGFGHDKEMAAINAKNQKDNIYLQWKLSNMTVDKNGNAVAKTQEQQQIPLTFTQQMINSSNQNKAQKYISQDAYHKNTSLFAQDSLKKAYSILGMADANKDGKLSKEEQANWKARYDKLNPLQKQNYDTYVKNYKYWDRINKEGLQGAIKNGLVDQYGNVTPMYVDKLAQITSKSTGKVLDPKDYNRLYSPYYNSVASTNSYGNKVLLNALTNNTYSKYVVDAANNKYGQKHPVINFADRGVYFGNVRAHNVSLGKNMTYGSVSMKFQRFLKNNKINGWIVSNSGLGAIAVPNKGKGQSLDIVANVSIPANTFKQFAEQNGGDIEDLAKKLGVRFMDRNGQSTNYIKGSNDIFVEIPVSRQMDNNNGQFFGQLDTEYDKAVYGSKEASGRELQQQYYSSQH